MNAGDDMLKVWRLYSDTLRNIWPICEALIRDGLAVSPTIDVDDLANQLDDGTIQLWAVVHEGSARVYAVFFTDLSENSGRVFLWVHGLGGRQIWRWSGLVHDTMLAFARRQRADYVRFAGRAGWGRLMRDCHVVGKTDCGQDIYERAVA